MQTKIPHEPDSNLSMYDWPQTTFDQFKGREWVMLQIPRYYLHQNPQGFWLIIDRDLDISVGKAFKCKEECVCWFRKNWRSDATL